ncbi:MAG: hypothetical protein ACXWYS_03595 [Gaiellaceae bacterium]
MTDGTETFTTGVETVTAGVETGTAGLEPRTGCDGAFGIVSVTVLVCSMPVTDTVRAGSGVETGGVVLAGGSFGVAGGVDCTGVVSGVAVAELEVAGVDGVDAGVAGVAALLVGVCVAVDVDVVVPAVAGGVEEVEADGVEEVFGAGAGAGVFAVRPLLAALAVAVGATAVTVRFAARAGRRTAVGPAGVRPGASAAATICGFVFAREALGASCVGASPTAGSSFAIATVRSTAAVASR